MTRLALLAVAACFATAEVVSSESQRLTQHGDAQLAAGNPLDAVESYRAAIAADGRAFEARVNLGAALVAAGDIDGAIEAMQAADKARPGSAPVLRNLGRALMARERWSEAVDPLRRAHATDPSNAEGTRVLGIALERAGSHGEAIALLKPAVATHPGDAELLLELASAQNALKDPAAAGTLEKARQAAGSGREGARIRNEIALRLREQGRIKDALEEFRAAARLDPTYAPALSNLGMALVEAGEWARAKGTLESAARRDNDPQLRYYLGQAKLETGDAKGAIADLEEARSWGYDPRAIGGMLARCWEALGQTANADSERAKAGIALEGKADHARKGYDLLQKGDLPKAIEELSAATQAEPTDYASQFNLGLAHLKLGDAAAAIAPLREAAAGLADQDVVWFALASAYEKSADLPHAAGAYTEMLQRFPKRADVSAHLGHLLLEMGQDASALDRLREAEKALPKDPAIEYDLAVAQVHLKHPDRALPPLKAYLAARSDDLEAREAYARALADSGDEKSAAAEFARLNAAEPVVARFAINAAVAWRKAGDGKQERVWLEKAAKLAPEDAAVASDLGRLQFTAKEWDAAAASFSRAAALDPANTDAAANAETARSNAAVGQMKASRLHLRVIVVKDAKQAKAVQSRLAAGEDFAKLAKALSTHESAAAGGDLGWVDPATLPDWAAPAKALAPGERSPTAPLAGGFAIFERLPG